MSPIVRTLYQESEFGIPIELPGAGTSLENPYAYDSAARELKSMADAGLVRITSERLLTSASPPLVTQLAFARLR
ncbi:MAG: hypothetical protein ABUU24_05700 [Variovorax sp.]